MGKHKSRIINIRCNATDETRDPPVYYKAKTYSYKFPKDELKYKLVQLAKASYREENEIPDQVEITTTESTQQT